MLILENKSGKRVKKNIYKGLKRFICIQRIFFHFSPIFIG